MITKFPEAYLERIKLQKSTFQEVEKRTGVPWQAIAAIWFRESFSVAPPKTVGGPFQFDPPLNAWQIKDLLLKFSDFSSDEIEVCIRKGVNDFKTAAYLCACFLRQKTKPVINPKVNDDIIKDAFWGYNGRAYGSADRSPYVMNLFDDKHMNMHLRGSIPDGKGGRKQIDIIDRRPGAFTLYKYLKNVNI